MAAGKTLVWEDDSFENNWNSHAGGERRHRASIVMFPIQSGPREIPEQFLAIGKKQGEAFHALRGYFIIGPGDPLAIHYRLIGAKDIAGAEPTRPRQRYRELTENRGTADG